MDEFLKIFSTYDTWEAAGAGQQHLLIIFKLTSHHIILHGLNVLRNGGHNKGAGNQHSGSAVELPTNLCEVLTIPG